MKKSTLLTMSEKKKNKPVAIQLTLPKEILIMTDKQAELEFRNRSELIRLALTEYIQKKSKERSLKQIWEEDYEN